MYNASATGSGATPRKLSNVQAHECGLWVCLNAHHINVSSGMTSQNIPSHWNKAKVGIDFTATANFTDIPKEFNVEPGIRYAVGNRAMMAMFSGIQSLLFGTVAASNPGEVAFIGNSGVALDGLKGLWYAADDIDGWMDNLARSLTNNIRLTGTTHQQNATLYDGVAWSEEVYFFVSWLWMIFPWTLVFLSVGFLIVTIVQNGQREPLKNSQSAELYERFEHRLHDAETSDMSLTELTIRMNTGNGSFKALPTQDR